MNSEFRANEANPDQAVERFIIACGVADLLSFEAEIAEHCFDRGYSIEETKAELALW